MVPPLILSSHSSVATFGCSIGWRVSGLQTAGEDRVQCDRDRPWPWHARRLLCLDRVRDAHRHMAEWHGMATRPVGLAVWGIKSTVSNHSEKISVGLRFRVGTHGKAQKRNKYQKYRTHLCYFAWVDTNEIKSIQGMRKKSVNFHQTNTICTVLFLTPISKPKTTARM